MSIGRVMMITMMIVIRLHYSDNDNENDAIGDDNRSINYDKSNDNNDIASDEKNIIKIVITIVMMITIIKIVR